MYSYLESISCFMVTNIIQERINHARIWHGHNIKYHVVDDASEACFAVSFQKIQFLLASFQIDNFEAMILQHNNPDQSSWAKLEGDFELRTTVEFQSEPRTTATTTTLESYILPPPLPSFTRTRKILLRVGLTVAAFDLCILPITFFYSLTFGTSLSKQDGTFCPQLLLKDGYWN